MAKNLKAGPKSFEKNKVKLALMADQDFLRCLQFFGNFSVIFHDTRENNSSHGNVSEITDFDLNFALKTKEKLKKGCV